MEIYYTSGAQTLLEIFIFLFFYFFSFRNCLEVTQWMDQQLKLRHIFFRFHGGTVLQKWLIFHCLNTQENETEEMLFGKMWISSLLFFLFMFIVILIIFLQAQQGRREKRSCLNITGNLMNWTTAWSCSLLNSVLHATSKNELDLQSG